MGIGKTRNLMWFVFARSALFSKKTGNRFSGSGGQNHRKLILKISTINLHGAGKLKRGEKDRHFLLSAQVFFIKAAVAKFNEHKQFQTKRQVLMFT